MGIHDSEEFLSWWDFIVVFLLRPLLAIIFVLSIILLSWFVAWKTVLVHVPLVQEIFGLRKKPIKPKPSTRHRLSRFYNSNSSPSQESAFAYVYEEFGRNMAKNKVKTKRHVWRRLVDMLEMQYDEFWVQELV